MNVKALRKRLRLTQAELAQIIGRTIVTVSNWERGVYQPDAEAEAELRKLAEQPTSYSVIETGSSSGYVLKGKTYILPGSDDPVTDSLRRVLESHGATPVPASAIETSSSGKKGRR